MGVKVFNVADHVLAVPCVRRPFNVAFKFLTCRRSVTLFNVCIIGGDFANLRIVTCLFQLVLI